MATETKRSPNTNTNTNKINTMSTSPPGGDATNAPANANEGCVGSTSQNAGKASAACDRNPGNDEPFDADADAPEDDDEPSSANIDDGIMEDGETSDAQESHKSTMKGGRKQHDAIPERRSSKRQRVPAPYRYSPGEGGGLASKKAKGKSDSNSNTTSATTTTESALVGTGTMFLPPRVNRGSDGDAGVPVPSSTTTDAQEKSGGEVVVSMSRPKPVREWSEPRYRWIGEGIKRDTTRSSSVEYAGVEIDFTSAPSEDSTSTPLDPLTVRIGDVVMINGGDAPWSGARQGSAIDSSQNSDIISLYNDPASIEMGLGALDPYLGLVERLWDEVDDDPSKSSPSSTMMMRTRWFFKKEDLEGISGRFVMDEMGEKQGNVRESILATMSARDVILTDQSDDNAISSILGKVKVVRRKPVDILSRDKATNETKSNNFICRFTLSMCPANSPGMDSTVKFRPCTDDNDDFKVAGRTHASSVFDSSDAEDDDFNSVVGTNTADKNNNVAPYSPSAFPMSPRRIVSEGVTTLGRIRIGPDHQAIIPQQIDLHRKSSFRGMSNPPSQRIPSMVWDPASDEGNHVDEFLAESTSLLMEHLHILGLQPFHDANYIESPDSIAEAKQPREVNIGSLLTELHECRGDVRKAIQKVRGSPEKYMTIWNKSEKEQFEAGYRIYRESIRMIANSVDGSKTCKDAVEYQYRFKFVENFRRFMRKKREKAEEIMATVEDRMLNEALRADERSQLDTGTDTSSSDEEEGSASALTNGAGGKLTAIPATRIGPLNNRIRTWFRTGGGGKDAVGATQQRRNLACGFLLQVRERVGEDAYDTLSKGIKACINIQAPDNSLSDVKAIAQDVMKTHPDLLEQFMSFLPEDIRCDEGAIASAM